MNKKEEQKYGDELTRLTQTIDESYERINSIPKVETDHFSTETLKSEVLPILHSAKDRICDISTVIENLNSVRSEIIDPVRGIVDQYYKVTKKSSVWGFAIGLFGMFLSVIAVFGINTETFFLKYIFSEQTFETEPNNSPAESSPLVEDRITGNISSFSDIDYFEVAPIGPGNLTVTMIPPIGQDYELFLVDEASKVIAKSTYLPGHIEYIKHILKEGSVFVAVAPCGSKLQNDCTLSSNDFTPGDYQLYVRRTKPKT
uniref:Uncharacterized protein n=1 Tax=Candidatus Kentrum sp. TC TaxID=2126339 RepID=A0A450ZJZ9_9GAMM|nr:MAG: hypothetical protein BECKTC1821F_GA0114240_10046 [Candidatus Kentron sp. TC]